ncbi:hypothetical protein N656DRAFT_161192 [Canariomyces notabilis]|uniref:Uncharacterized protein n=1 Tax=Canariomyces notabilis TaxID=2074819 RepID=A0AAN6TBR7_9PEZI|nr:hypothetical protein N656DRAFT_161192 [Canariomyces arenarius]
MNLDWRDVKSITGCTCNTCRVCIICVSRTLMQILLTPGLWFTSLDVFLRSSTSAPPRALVYTYEGIALGCLWPCSNNGRLGI